MSDSTRKATRLSTSQLRSCPDIRVQTLMTRSRAWSSRGFAAAFILSGVCLLGTLTSAPCFGQAGRAISAEAVAGEPFGVASVKLPLNDADRRIWGAEGFQIVDPQGRVFYPTFSQGTVRRFLAEVIGRSEPSDAKQVEVSFLFRGREPFEFTIETSEAHRIQVRPMNARPVIAERLWQVWWREFVAASRIQDKQSDYPPVVETYLVAMLGTRLGRDLPLMSRNQDEPVDELRETLELLMGVEDLRYQIMRETMIGSVQSQPLDQPLPADVTWQAPYTPDLGGAEIPVETLSHHVPEECLYVRFGSWSNQIWLKNFLKSYGEDLSRLIALRGYDARLDDRMQSQIGIVDSKINDLLGGNLVNDVALIGFDTFLREGAGMGVVLEQRNGLLRPAIDRQRAQLAQQYAEQGATLETISIGGHEVSFLSTPDNQLRSFYAVDEGIHLMTNSQKLVERFFEAGAGVKSLASSAEFQFARSEYPLERNDSVFVYLSSSLFRNLLTPQYQIELRRRLQSVTDIELVQMAKWVAQAEGVEDNSLEGWIEAGLLPEGFGRRADGSGVVITDDQAWDSMRGRRGYFLPIADVPLESVSVREADDYAQRASYFSSRWQRMDPMIVALRRESIPEGTLVKIDAKVAPFGEDKYGWVFSMLGPPMESIVQGQDSDVVSVQASLKGGMLLPLTPPHRLFFTLENRGPTTEGPPENLLDWFQVARSAPGYIGASPKPGFLDMIPLGLGAQPDAEGFTHSLLGVWRWQGADMSLLSFDQGRLRSAASGMHYVPLAEPAHVYAKLGEIGESELRPWIEQAVYLRARDTTMGNLRLLGQVSRQLKVPVEDALTETQEILDVTLRCSLDGEYQLVTPEGLFPRWRSTHLDPLQDEALHRPSVHVLDWLHSAEVALRKDESQVVLWGDLKIRETSEEPSGEAVDEPEDEREEDGR